MGKSTLTLEVLIGARTDSSYNSALNKAMKDVGKFAKTTNRAFKIASTGFVATQFGKVVGDAIKTYGDFEQSMANTGAIASATTVEYQKMWDAARQAGRTTTMTAKESADALGYMSLAGWDVNSSTRALLPVLRLAEATGKDLQTTSDLVTDSMGALQLNVEDLDVYMDKLVKTNNKANTSAEQLMQSIIKSGGAMRNVGAETDELITAIGILANNGVKGTEAGTAMNAILTRIWANPQAKKGLKEIGVDLFDMNGQFIGIENSLKKLNEAYSGLTDEERSHVSRLIGGIQYGTKLKYLIDSVAEGADGSASKWSKLESAIGDSAGSLDEMNKRATSTIPAAAERLNSAINDMKISTVDVFGDDIRFFLDDMAQRVPDITDRLTSFLQENRGAIRDMADSAFDMAEGLGTGVVDAMSFLMKHQSIIGGMFGMKLSSMFAPGLSSLIEASLESEGGLFSVLSQFATSGNAITGVLTGITTGLSAVYFGAKQWDSEMKKASFEEHFGNIALSLSEIDSIADNIVGMGEVRAFNREMEELDSISADIDRNLSNIEKINWQSMHGIKVSDTDLEEYQQNMDAYRQSITDFVNQKGYMTELSLDNLFGDSAAGSYFKGKASEYYAGISGDIEGLGKELAKLLNDAFADGVLDADEAEVIRKKQAQIQKIKAELEQEEYDNQMNILTGEYVGRTDAESYKEMLKRVGEKNQEKLDSIDSETRSALTQANSQSEKSAIINQGKINKAKQTGDVAKQMSSVFYETYSDELLRGAPTLDKTIDEVTSKYLTSSLTDNYGQSMQQMMNDLYSQTSEAMSGKISLQDQLGMRDIYKEFLPMRQQLQQQVDDLAAVHKKAPQEVLDAIHSIDLAGAISGDVNALYNYAGEMAANSPEKAAAIQRAQASGEEFPKALGQGIANNASASKPGVDTAYNTVKSYCDSKPDIVTTKKWRVNLDVEYQVRGWGTLETNTPGGVDLNQYIKDHNATGGIVASPTVTHFAEKSPEAAIPIDGSSRSKGLWERTGRMLGMGSAMQDTTEQVQTTNVTFAPTINISGKADAQEVRRGVTAGFEEFRSMMKRYERETNRRSFAR